MQRVLAISGKRFSGKDTFAGLLREAARRAGHELPVYAFADESKRMFAAANADVELARLLADRAYKESVRPRLTAFTMAAIAADPLVFCREVARRIDDGGTPALISDLRLQLELTELRPRFELRVLRLARGDAARAASGWVFKAGVDDHATETELDDPARWDEIVPNDGSIAELGERAGDVIARFYA